MQGSYGICSPVGEPYSCVIKLSVVISYDPAFYSWECCRDIPTQVNKGMHDNIHDSIAMVVGNWKQSWYPTPADMEVQCGILHSS